MVGVVIGGLGLTCTLWALYGGANFKIFGLDGTFRGTSHLIRADLYQGQPCPQTGSPYFFIPVIGYYRCEHF